MPCSPAAGPARRSRRSTAARCGSWCRISISGKAPNGCRRSNSSARMRRAIGRSAAIITAAIPGASSAIPTTDAMTSKMMENACADRTFPIHRRGRPSARGRARSTGTRTKSLRAVRALLHLRQGCAGGETNFGSTGSKRHRGVAVRFHGPWLQRGRFRPLRIKRQFLDDIAEHGLMAHVTNLHKALLIMHSPTDDTVGIDNATHIFVAAKHPKSFVSLADADHLLTQRRDAAYVAGVIAAWSERYLDPAAPEQAADLGKAPRHVVVRETRNSKFQQTVTIGPHRMLADEPLAVGGEDSGPGPYDFLLAGLGACTSMTMRLYADRKSLPLDRVTVTLQHGK